MRYWCLILDDVEDCCDTIYFKSYEIAKANFEIICEKYKDYDDFERDETNCSWFDDEYDEFSLVRLRQLPIPTIYDKIIFNA